MQHTMYMHNSIRRCNIRIISSFHLVTRCLGPSLRSQLSGNFISTTSAINTYDVGSYYYILVLNNNPNHETKLNIKINFSHLDDLPIFTKF